MTNLSNPITNTEKSGFMQRTPTTCSNDITFDPKQNKLLEARVLALQERCDMLLKELGDCEKEKQEVKDACGRLNGELIAAKEELKDYPVKIAQASKARYWEGVAKTYGSLLKYLGMRIDNNYDQQKYQTCVDGKDATVNRITREIVEKSPKYIEQDKRIKKLLANKHLLANLIDSYVDRDVTKQIFEYYRNQGGA